MNRQIHVRPTRPGLAAMAVAGLLFLLFGIFLFGAAQGDARPYVLMFGAVWVSFCLFLILYGIYGLLTRRPPAMTVFEEQTGPGGPSARRDGDFGEKLRELEGLRKDGLIRPEEYRRKRAEIMERRW